MQTAPDNAALAFKPAHKCFPEPRLHLPVPRVAAVQLQESAADTGALLPVLVAGPMDEFLSALC